MIETEALVILNHMIAGTRRTHVPGFELYDVKSHAPNAGITGRAQSATCVFCNRTIVSWPGRPATRRNPRALPGVLERATRSHTPRCALDWMWTTLARWSTGFASESEGLAITTWRDRFPRVEPVFARLPAPPNSEMAQNLEVALIKISRSWSY